MSGRAQHVEARLLVVMDLERLGPIVRENFAPRPIFGVRNYLAAIAELPKSPTRAVLIGHDPTCRKPGEAIKALRRVAGEAPLVYCCEPAYEDVGRQMVACGADDYVIFPPEPAELERALRIPSKKTQQEWLEAPNSQPVPTAEELAKLADLLAMMNVDNTHTLDAVAELVATAVGAERATVILQGRTGHAGPLPEVGEEAALVENVTQNEQRAGQIRVGPKKRGAYSLEDTSKLRHYGTLIGRLEESAARADELRRLAYTDELTGLANRRRLHEYLDEKLAVARKAGLTVTLLYFDIDDFKQYNDAYGHEAGDEILVDIGRLFSECTRDSDLVARYGGDEFVVVFWDPEGPRMVGSNHPRRVMHVVKRFVAALKNHTFSRLGPDAKGRMTISGGIANFPWDAQTAHDLIEAADRALFQAKDAGKSRFWIVGESEVTE